MSESSKKELHVRIEKDLVRRVKSDAKLNGRSAQKEANHVLRNFYGITKK